jgi:hypothetical protein
MEYGNMEIEIPEETLLLQRIPSYSQDGVLSGKSNWFIE